MLTLQERLARAVETVLVQFALLHVSPLLQSAAEAARQILFTLRTACAGWRAGVSAALLKMPELGKALPFDLHTIQVFLPAVQSVLATPASASAHAFRRLLGRA